MFKLIITLLVCVSLSTLMPCVGSAQHIYSNQIGLFMNSDGTGATSTNEIGAPVNVYLVLLNPSDDSGTPFSGITAFDCQLNFNPIGGLFVTNIALNGEGLNIGDVNNIDQGYLEFLAGFADVVLAIDGAVLLISLQFINTNVGEVYVTMSPISQPSFPDAMSFLPGEISMLYVMYPASGDYENPVFAFNGQAVPVVKESFG